MYHSFGSILRANFHFSPRPRSTWNVGARMIQLTLWVAFAGLGDDLFRRKSPLSPGWASESRCFIVLFDCFIASKLSKLQLGSFSSSRATQVFEGFSSFAASFTWSFASCYLLLSCHACSIKKQFLTIQQIEWKCERSVVFQK